MTRRLFGTDGVRGIANAELTPELAMGLGAAAAQVLGAGADVVVGRDPRRSGDLLEAALVAGILSQGVHVTAVGILPTPGVSFATRTRGAAAGVVLSASHNPMPDNGIKFFGPDGHKLPEALEARIEGALEGWERRPRPVGAGVGRLVRDRRAATEYARFLAGTLAPFRLEGLKIVLDCAHGAASRLAPRLLASLGAAVTALSAAPDGLNINENCGSLHPETMAETVLRTGADLGMAFDGDADRVILADERGRVFDGDRILCMAGLYLHETEQLRGDVVVGTVMSNLGLEQALGQRGIRLVRADVGDRHVAAKLLEFDAALGGEQSGHILFPRISPAGDGLLTGLQLCKILHASGRPLSSWADEMQKLPQRLVNVSVRSKEGWNESPALRAALAAAEARLDGRGRILVRPSGTEKKIRVMAEGPDATEVSEVTEAVAATIRAERGAA